MMMLRFKHWVSILLLLILGGALSWLGSYLRRPTTLPFHHIRIKASLKYINDQELTSLAWHHLQGGFFSLKTFALKSALCRNPWVRAVSLRRQWPDTLVVVIQEKQPWARWGDNGVVSLQKEIFYPAKQSIPHGLPMIIGSKQNKDEILANFAKFNEDLKFLALDVRKVTVNDWAAYRVTLSNGILVVVGRNHVIDRFDRFVGLYLQIISTKAAQVRSVDLRYTNGLAIQWEGKH